MKSLLHRMIYYHVTSQSYLTQKSQLNGNTASFSGGWIYLYVNTIGYIISVLVQNALYFQN